MAPQPDLDPVARLYTASAQEHGLSSQGVGWPDAGSHQLRLGKLCTVLGEDDGEVTVNDLGCGYGALYQFLQDRGVRVGRYYGYDISREMLELAARALPGPNVDLIESDHLLHEADYSFACGIFNVRLEVDVAAWEAHVHRVLDDLHAHSRRGFAFNALSTHVDFRRDHLYYADPTAYFELCRQRYSRRVALLHDYPLYEWTMVIRHT